MQSKAEGRHVMVLRQRHRNCWYRNDFLLTFPLYGVELEPTQTNGPNKSQWPLILDSYWETGCSIHTHTPSLNRFEASLSCCGEWPHQTKLHSCARASAPSKAQRLKVVVFFPPLKVEKRWGRTRLSLTSTVIWTSSYSESPSPTAHDALRSRIWKNKPKKTARSNISK